MRTEKIAVAMSGGVDSSLAAALLLEQGNEVMGFFMRLDHDSSTKEHRVAAVDGEEAARRIAKHLGFPFYAVSLGDVFEEAIVNPFVDDYLHGRTPNPCIHCNALIKMGALWEEARGRGAKTIATGHYIRLKHDPEQNRMALYRGSDTSKDQSYYLFSLNQEQLARLRTPLGEWTKEDVRREAKRRGLPTAQHPESQEICFIPDQDYREFLLSHLGPSQKPLKGPIVDTHGRVLGQHQGLPFYTIGQRKGLGITHARPLYVVELQTESNTVVVGESDTVYSRSLTAARVNWVSIAPPQEPFQAEVQIRYRHQPAPARITLTDEGQVEVVFDKAQRAVTPGQAVVFYEGDCLLGGGWIEKRFD